MGEVPETAVVGSFGYIFTHAFYHGFGLAKPVSFHIAPYGDICEGGEFSVQLRAAHMKERSHLAYPKAFIMHLLIEQFVDLRHEQ